MVQHVLLLLVAAPLIVLARPWIRLWRCAAAALAPPLARGAQPGRSARAPLRALSALPRHARGRLRAVLRRAARLARAGACSTRRCARQPLHALEHTLFFATARAVLEAGDRLAAAARHASRPPQRVLYVIGAMIVSWVLAVVLALAPHPLYAPLRAARGRPGGISALADQQLAAGIMWVPGSITFLIVIFVYVHRWLTPPDARACSGQHTAGERALGGLMPEITHSNRLGLPDRLDPHARAAAGRADRSWRSGTSCCGARQRRTLAALGASLATAPGGGTGRSRCVPSRAAGGQSSAVLRRPATRWPRWAGCA